MTLKQQADTLRKLYPDVNPRDFAAIAKRFERYDVGSGAPMLQGSESASTVKAAKLIDALRSKGITTSEQAGRLADSDWWEFANLAGIGKPSKLAIQKAINRIGIDPSKVALPLEYTRPKPQAVPVEAPSELEDQLARSIEQAKARKAAVQAPEELAEPTAAAPIESAPAGHTFESVSQKLQDAADAALERLRQRGTLSGTKLNAGIPLEDMGDMAIWGAAKMAKGVVDFGKWSKELIAEAGDNIKPYLQELYAKAQKIYSRHLETTANALPNTQQMLKMYKQGIEGQDWYANTHEELSKFFGDDTNRFVDFLAATSPNNTVAGNVSQALKAYMQYKNGQPFTGFLPAHIDMLNKAAADQPFGGLKVSSFAKNLKGDPIAVTVDRWIARAMGLGDAVTPQQYKFADYLITQVANKKGIEPRQLQAAIWKAMKDSQGIAGQTGDAFEAVLQRKLMKDPDLAGAIAGARNQLLPAQ
jgi:hypothetical protein